VFPRTVKRHRLYIYESEKLLIASVHIFVYRVKKILMGKHHDVTFHPVAVRLDDDSFIPCVDGRRCLYSFIQHQAQRYFAENVIVLTGNIFYANYYKKCGFAEMNIMNRSCMNGYFFQ